jgi:hypothetical protein
MEEGEKAQALEGIENLLSETTAENFPNYAKNMHIQVRDIYNPK